MTETEAKFLEELSVRFEEDGEPHIAGLIMGWLLICEPPEQSFNQLVDELQVSKGSVSNMTRHLEYKRLIEKVRKPGERQIYFRIRPSAWEEVMNKHLEITRKLYQIAQKGIDLLEHESEERKQRLMEMRNFFAFASSRIPDLIAEYQNRNEGSGS